MNPGMGLAVKDTLPTNPEEGSCSLCRMAADNRFLNGFIKGCSPWIWTNPLLLFILFSYFFLSFCDFPAAPLSVTLGSFLFGLMQLYKTTCISKKCTSAGFPQLITFTLLSFIFAYHSSSLLFSNLLLPLVPVLSMMFWINEHQLW